VEQGRITYANIQKFVFYLLSTNIAEVFVILIAVVIGLESPLVPTQILWLNLATDICPALALAVEAGDPSIMNEGPRPIKEPFIEKVMTTGIIFQAFTLTWVCLMTYIVGLKWETGYWNAHASVWPGLPLVNSTDPITNPLDYDFVSSNELAFRVRKAQTMTILTIVFAELMRAYTSRSLRRSIFEIGIFSNRWMQYSVFASIGITMFLTNTPGPQDLFGLEYITGREWGFVFGVSFIPAVLDELTKWIYRRTGFGERPVAAHLMAAAKAKAQKIEAEAKAEKDKDNAPNIELKTMNKPDE